MQKSTSCVISTFSSSLTTIELHAEEREKVSQREKKKDNKPLGMYILC